MIKQFVIPAAVMVGVASAAAAPGGLFEDCSKSTAPHSTRCLMDWWHNAGCTSNYALSKEAGWVDEEDIYNIKKEMQDVYKKAAADNADPADVNKCQPIPKWQKRQQDCYVALQNDCKDCFVGPLNMLVNTTCTASCIDNSDSLQSKCVNLYNAIQCDRKVEDLCGDCVSTGFLGIPIIDPQCFTDCYQKNNQTIRDACPLPEPLQKAKDCHDKLADVCKDCVSGEHDIDGKCLASCWDDNEATLNKTCPVQFEQLASFLSSIDDSAILSNLANGLANGGEVTEIGSLFNGGSSSSSPSGMGMPMGMGNGDLQGVLSQITGIFQSLFGQLFNGQQPEGTITVTTSSPQGDQQMPQGVEDILSQFGFAPPQQQPADSTSQGTSSTPPQGQNIDDILAQFGFAPQQPQQPQQEKPQKPQKKPTSSAAPEPTNDSNEDMNNMMAPVDSTDSTSSDATSADNRSPDGQPLVNGLQMLLGGQQQG